MIRTYFGVCVLLMLTPCCKTAQSENNNDATLAALSVSEGILSPAFAAGTTEYRVDVADDVTSVTVTGTANNAKATVEGNVNSKTLQVGDNAVEITVTAEDGTTKKVYKINIVRADPSVKNAQTIRDMAEEFLQGNPLPHSFIGSTAMITDPYQKNIAENGVIVYDLAVLLKALVLYPEQNKTMIEQIVNALQNGTNVRSNADFIYGSTNIPTGHGYFFKIIDVRSRWLQDQSLPVTGENAWLASAMASVRKAFPNTELAQKAYDILKDLATAMYALQTGDGFLRMAPKTANNYGGDANYYEIVSVENCISSIPVFRYMSESADSPAEKSKYKTALDKLETALTGMFDQSNKYFFTGKDLTTKANNPYFASDCQTWMILAFGVNRLNSLLKTQYGIDNASLELLKTTLNLAGMQQDGKYLGIDFSQQKQMVSFEWTIGFMIAAKQVLTTVSDTQLANAVADMSKYITDSQTNKGILKYINVNSILPTGHGWLALPMESLASSAWNLYLMLDSQKTPFDI